MNPLPIPCACCGFDGDGSTCQYCGGTARSLDGRSDLPSATADGPRAFVSGLLTAPRAMLALLHGREYIGRLRLPIVLNAIGFTLLVVGGWLGLAPAFAAAFAGPWWLFDGLRTASASAGPPLWLATTWLLLGHPLLDLVAGAAQEPLREATERRMLGPPRGPVHARGLLRLRERARVFACLLLAWPLALGLVLLPWVGLPLVTLLGAAVAAVVWFEAPMAARGWPLRHRLASLWAHRWRALGVGLALQLASVVPFVNCLGLAPIATIAATASFLRFGKRPPA